VAAGCPRSARAGPAQPAPSRLPVSGRHPPASHLTPRPAALSSTCPLRLIPSCRAECSCCEHPHRPLSLFLLSLSQLRLSSPAALRRPSPHHSLLSCLTPAPLPSPVSPLSLVSRLSSLSLSLVSPHRLLSSLLSRLSLSRLSLSLSLFLSLSLSLFVSLSLSLFVSLSLWSLSLSLSVLSSPLVLCCTPAQRPRLSLSLASLLCCLLCVRGWRCRSAAVLVLVLFASLCQSAAVSGNELASDVHSRGELIMNRNPMCVVNAAHGAILINPHLRSDVRYAPQPHTASGFAHTHAHSNC
jgi:hypothetical protein